MLRMNIYALRTGEEGISHGEAGIVVGDEFHVIDLEGEDE